MLERLVERLARTPVWISILAAVAVVVGCSAASAVKSSLVVDGTRYFWLDDDQMITMRYARNLAEGHGLVWNPGERVEGYTSLLWTVILAGLHLLPLADAHMALAVRVLNALAACAVLLSVLKLLRVYLPDPGFALPIVLLLTAASHELLFWSMHGFETPLLTLLYLGTLLGILRGASGERLDLRTYLLMGLLPLARSDGHHLWAAAGLLVVALTPNLSRAVARLAVAAVLPLAHLAGRRLYYGDWLPNTYYLKVAGFDIANRLERGLGYAAYFAMCYWLVLFLALLGALVCSDRRRVLGLAGFALSLAYVVGVGGDNFPGARFLAPQAPLLLVLAAAGARDLCPNRRTGEFALLSAGAGAYAVFALFMAVASPAFPLIVDRNGGPEESLLTALAIRENTAPEARVAVHAAGLVPYFSRRHAIDCLGKADRHVAHLAPQGRDMGHNKLDPDYSLGQERPDLAVMLWLPQQVAACSARDRGIVASEAPPWVAKLYLSPVFQSEFCGGAVDVPGGAPVYLRRSSPERGRASLWRMPRSGL